MNIFLLNSFPQWGGGEKQTINALEHLRQRGHQVFLGCLPGSPIHKKAQEKGLDVFPVQLKMDTAFWIIPSLRRFLKEKQIEVFVAMQNRDAKIGALTARLARVPVIFSWQGLNVMKKKIDHRITYTRFVDGIIVNAQSLKDQYLEYGWFNDDFIKVVYEGMEPLPEIEAADIRGTYKLPPSTKVILAVGRLVYQKGFDLLLQAAGMAKDRGLDWQFLIAGDGKLKKELQEMSKSLKVDDRVHFLGFQSNVLPLMKGADLFVLPSRSEGMPNVLREAMAMGRACIAAAVDGVPELIEPEKSGVLVEKENVRQLFDEMSRVLSDEQLRAALGQNANRRVTEIFTMDNMIDRMEAVFLAQTGEKTKSP